ncbi:MAG: tubulin-like doman-containing protein [Corynebacterium sp.]|uniref:tubulin-like doman-containing protein n=1 Tax=Corynebacterium sp. TaxID=1720 RepID=UPI0026DA82C7|nr:tubulin-like doman-containing protein [Corynebacterium sp.]MDO5097457.1 tubulin-like doman-containing protein [Corynebacterium sp.]
MRKFLVVGCGGSGAKTQAYMIDQLKALLRTIQPERTRLPQCWQFVTIDVPIAPEAGPDNLPNVQQCGGRYIGIGSRQRYSTFDTGTTSELIHNGGLKEVATWVPRVPGAITTPVSEGAGQYRALGRMLTIPAIKKIQDGLNSALDALNTTEAHTELDELNLAITGKSSHSRNTSPVILVISSMAGGAGASMFLDICRILSTLPNAKPEHTGVFMLTPEVFSEIPPEMMVGTWPNSLAMFGEAIASQTGAAAASDAQLYEALGINGANRPTTFGRMFPIGNRMGEEGAKFGDGSSTGVYRGLGRALSALMYSDQASDSFVQYSLANTGSPGANRDYLGWADPAQLKWDGMPWGSMGYAQLSMGRDKYAEYSAQRLARSAFDRLLTGHIDPTNLATGEEQLKAKLAERMPYILQELRINPEFRGTQPTGSMISGWLDANFETEITNAVSAAVYWLRQALPQPSDGQQSRDWAREIEQRLGHPNISTTLATNLNNAAYAAVYEYADWLLDSVLSVAERELSVVGVPFVEAVLGEINDIIQQGIAVALHNAIGNATGMNPAAKPADIDALLHPLSGNKRVHGGGEILDAVAAAYRPQLRTYMLVALARVVHPVLEDFRVTALQRLMRELETAHVDLSEAARRKDTVSHLADVSTTDPVAWPTDTDERISDRFRGSFNEILITEVDSFPIDYANQLIETVKVSDPSVFDLSQAVRLAARSVIVGKWESTDAIKAPEDTLAPPSRPEVSGNRAGWVSKHLQTPPAGGEIRESSPAVFAAKIRPADLLGRARSWINRTGYHFERFISMDLRSYMTQDESVNDVEYQQRLNRLRSAFSTALSQARPLAGVNAAMVSLVHGSDVTYRYSFSEIPFQHLTAADTLSDVLNAVPHLHDQTKTVFLESLSDAKKVQRIDVFGSYPNYSPIVFSSLLPAISNDWSARMDKENAWMLRRARPLPAALPLSNDERRALVAGWILGLATGRVYVHNQGQKDARAWVFDGKEWLPFPQPMLTPPSQMRNSVDWMPAVIESILLAYAESHNKDANGKLAQSLRPYQALRGIYDDSSQHPTNSQGGIQHPAVGYIAQFLRDGVFPAGDNKVVGDGIEDRAELITEALTRAGAVADKFVHTPSNGFPGATPVEKVWANPPSREHASNMPFYRDFAPDVLAVIRQLKSMVDQAKLVAARPAAESAPVFDAGHLSDNGSTSSADFGDFGGLV